MRITDDAHMTRAQADALAHATSTLVLQNGPAAQAGIQGSGLTH